MFDEIACFKASALLDAFAGVCICGYIYMVDVEGFDDSVVYSLDLGRHRPKLIAFESKVMQSVRPEALYDVVEFCSMRGYKAVGPVKANHVCIRDDRSVPRRACQPATPPAPPATRAGLRGPEPEALLPGAAGDPRGMEPLPEAKRLTAPGTALGAADKNGNVAEWYFTDKASSAHPRFARRTGPGSTRT